MAGAAAVPFVCTLLACSALSALATLSFAVILVLLTAPFVVGTFGDLIGVAFDIGFRVGVNLAVVVVFVDVIDEVLGAGL